MNRMLLGLLLVAGVFAAIPRAAASQEVISRGAIVRVTAPSAGLVGHRGRLDDVTADSIRVDVLRIARAEITSVEVGRTSSNFLRYSGIGLVTGVALGAAVCLNECPSGGSDISKGGLMMIYTVFAGGGGLVLGAVAGGLTHRVNWRSVPVGSLQPTLAPTPDGPFQLGVRIPR